MPLLNRRTFNNMLAASLIAIMAGCDDDTDFINVSVDSAEVIRFDQATSTVIAVQPNETVTTNSQIGVRVRFFRSNDSRETRTITWSVIDAQGAILFNRTDSFTGYAESVTLTTSLWQPAAGTQSYTIRIDVINNAAQDSTDEQDDSLTVSIPVVQAIPKTNT